MSAHGVMAYREKQYLKKLDLLMFPNWISQILHHSPADSAPRGRGAGPALLCPVPAASEHWDQEGKGRSSGQQQPGAVLSPGWPQDFGKQRGRESKNVFAVQTDFPPLLCSLFLQIRFGAADFDKSPFLIRQR